ncbi:MAG TPA: hypothetical protein PLO56_01165 [Rhodothermales bacterium]|nr:hypothetical protein [Rhodothermales bacterium]
MQTHQRLGIWFILMMLLCSSETIRAQGIQIFKGLKIGGTVGVSGEAYTASGIENRRAPLLGRANANLTADLFGLKTGINLLYSTDESKIRQSINRLAFNTQYKSLAVGIGGVTPTLSKYSLNGVVVRGGLIGFSPGKFDLMLTGGQSKRTTTATTEDAFRGEAIGQNIGGARLGYGRKGHSFFSLSGLYGRDKGIEFQGIEQAPIPAENYVLAPQAGISLFRGKLKLDGSLTASVFNRNRNTSNAPNRDAAFFGLVPLPATTQLAYAGEGALQLSLKSFRLQGGYERVEQGFETMGLSQIRDDQASFRVAPQIRLFGRKVQARFNYQNRRNNLNNTRNLTTNRSQWGGNLIAQVSEWLSLSGAYDQSNNTGTNADNIQSARQEVRTFMFSPAITLQRGEIGHNLMLNASLQSMQDLRAALRTDTQNLNGTLTYSLSLPEKRTLGLTGNYLRSDAPQVITTASGIQTNYGFSTLKEKVTVNLGASWSGNRSEVVALEATTGNQNITGQQWGVTLNTAWLLPWKDRLQLMIRGLSSEQNSGNGAPAQSFREIQATLQLSHSF